MANEVVIYSYKGNVDTVILKTILESLDSKLSERGEEKIFRKKVNSIMIECLQNMIFYVDRNNSAIREPEVKVIHSDQGYEIFTGNIIASDKTDKLGKYIDRINNMTKDQQRDYYQEVLANGQFNEQGGAGLGFVNIVRKTKNNKLDYKFEPLNHNHFQYFVLHISV